VYSFVNQFPALAMSSLLTTGLLSVRLSAVLMMTPVLAATSMPPTTRVLLSVGMAAGLAAAFPQWRAPAELGAGELFSALLTELAVGLAMALGVQIAFAAFAVAGRLLDVQIGFGIAQVFDPVTRRQLPILTAVLNQFAVLMFFVINGHHALLRGLVYSLEQAPVARPWLLESSAGPVLKHVSALFSLGFVLVAPVVFCLLMLEFALGVLTRNLPQMHMFILSQPLKLIVGLGALALWMLGLQAPLDRVYASIFQTWEALFQHG